MEYQIQTNGRLLGFNPPLVMGILNATPDSFYSGSRQQTEEQIAERTLQIVSQGGAIIDVGAFSTRPGAAEVSQADEMARLRTALSIVRREAAEAVVSVDTFRPEVARMAVEEYGANIINDVSEGGLTGVAGVPLSDRRERTADDATDVPAMFSMVAKLQVPYILMSVQPTLRDTLLSFAHKTEQLRALGQKDMILDPGFGFGKSLQQNYELLAQLEKLNVLGLPLLVGVSRKSMIFRQLGTTPDEALNGTTALHAVALMKGASILRVHDVREAVEAVKLVEAVRQFEK